MEVLGSERVLTRIDRFIAAHQADWDRLAALSAKHGTRHFYLSQDSVAPKTIVKLAGALVTFDCKILDTKDMATHRVLFGKVTGLVRHGDQPNPGTPADWKDGDDVKKEQVIFSWDPYTNPIIADVEGTIRFVDLVEDESVSEELDELTGLRQRVVIEDREKKLHPHIEIWQEKSGKEKRLRDFVVPVGAQLTVQDGAKITAGTIIAKIGREAYKTRDITGGLPRVAELFEARRPKDPATISEIDGVVSFGEIKRGKREIIVVPNQGAERVLGYTAAEVMGESPEIFHTREEIARLAAVPAWNAIAVFETNPPCHVKASFPFARSLLSFLLPARRKGRRPPPIRAVAGIVASAAPYFSASQRAPPPALRAIAELVDQRHHVDTELTRAVWSARSAHRSWSEIGAMLYELVISDLSGETSSAQAVDALAFRRDPADYRSCWLVEAPCTVTMRSSALA